MAFQHFDAFGIALSPFPVGQSGRYRWRSQEGSETDDLESSPTPTLTEPKLIYMQTRHYDPETGRFLQADTLPMGAFSPQGLNRYTYCTNDPVNCSDATGLLSWLTPILVVILVGILMAFSGNPLSFLGALVGAILAIMMYIGQQVGSNFCTGRGMGDIDEMLIAGISGAVVGGIGPKLHPSYARAFIPKVFSNLRTWASLAGLGGFIGGLLLRLKRALGL